MSIQSAPDSSPFDEPIISAEKLTKTYRTGKIEVQALREVDLTIPRGEMVAIMGPSGCGKTTLLNCLSGLDDFDAGQVVIEGEPLRKMSDRKRTTYRAQRMGFIFQTFNLLPVLTAAENVELPLLVSGTRPREARERALASLEQVGLGDRTTHRPAELSGGQRQRVTIARSLVNDPAIIWADEPTGNLDSKTTSDILSVMRQLNQEQQRTFVIVTHTDEVSDWCDRIIYMSDGRIVDDGLSLKAKLDLAGRNATGPDASSEEEHQEEHQSNNSAPASATSTRVDGSGNHAAELTEAAVFGPKDSPKPTELQES